MNGTPEIPGQDSKVGDSSSPPILKSWARLYSFVLGELVLLIVLFYMFSRFYQ
jgi:hypothetical protein